MLGSQVCVTMSGFLQVPEIHALGVALPGEPGLLASKPSPPTPRPGILDSSFTLYSWAFLAHIRLLNRCPFVGAGDCRQGPEVAEILRLVCVEPAVTMPWPVPVPSGCPCLVNHCLGRLSSCSSPGPGPGPTEDSPCPCSMCYCSARAHGPGELNGAFK